MYTSFSIKNFRCFENMTIEPLARVNLICGENNTGKTALLEALWLHSGPNSPDLGLRLYNFRGVAGPDPRRLLHDLFRNFDPHLTISFLAISDVPGRRLGEAADAGVWEWNSSALQPLAEFLRRL